MNIELGNSMEPQLYDLKKDAGEKNNLAKEQPKRVQQLSAELEKVVDGRYGLPLY